MALGYIVTLRNDRLDRISAAVGTNGLIRIYDGVRPATGGAATVLLAELTVPGAFAPAAAAAVLTVNAVTQDASANNGGTATWFRVLTSAAAAVFDGNVAVSGSDMNLTATLITAGGPVSISSFTITGGNP